LSAEKEAGSISTINGLKKIFKQKGKRGSRKTKKPNEPSTTLLRSNKARVQTPSSSEASKDNAQEKIKFT
jgi:hypothetical protein